MFNLKPVGKFHVQVCTNCACLIRRLDTVWGAVKEMTGLSHSGETSEDGMFTITEVECLAPAWPPP